MEIHVGTKSRFTGSPARFAIPCSGSYYQPKVKCNNALRSVAVSKVYHYRQYLKVIVVTTLRTREVQSQLRSTGIENER